MRRLFPPGQICSQAENLLANILLYHRDAFPLPSASFLHVPDTPSGVYIFPSSRGENGGKKVVIITFSQGNAFMDVSGNTEGGGLNALKASNLTLITL